MYYNYHGVVKKKIKNGLLEHLELVEKDNKARMMLIIYFKDGTKYPIKEEFIREYLEIIRKQVGNN